VKEPAQSDPGEACERLEERADRVRSRLFSDLDELKARGQRVTDRVEALKTSARRHPGVLAGVAFAAAATVGLVLYARRARRRREMRRDAILGFAARLLGPAYVVEPAERRRGMLGESVKKAGGALVAAVGREFGRRALVLLTTPAMAHPEARGPA
jgi:hypothetical protein